MTASDLARAVSVSATAVANWEKGSMPRSAALERLAVALNTSVEYIKTGRNKSLVGQSAIDAAISKAAAEIAKLMDVPASRVKLTIEVKSK